MEIIKMLEGALNGFRTAQNNKAANSSEFVAYSFCADTVERILKSALASTSGNTAAVAWEGAQKIFEEYQLYRKSKPAPEDGYISYTQWFKKKRHEFIQHPPCPPGRTTDTPKPCACINRHLIGDVGYITYSWCRDCGTLYQTNEREASAHKPRGIVMP